MPKASWNIWLLNKGEKPLLYLSNMTEAWAKKRLIQCADKVFDGSDADAFILLRSDYVLMSAHWIKRP